MSQITFAEKASAPATPAANQAVLYIDSNGDLCLKDDAGNVLTISFSGTVTLTAANTGTVALLGVAQTFTALKTFSAGIAFANETLSTYDEGTWTPVLSDAASGGNLASIGTNYGSYIKIGKLVSVSFQCSDITTAGMTGGNTLTLQSLPFASQNNANYRATGSVRVENVAFSSYVVSFMQGNATTANFREHATGAASATLTVSDLTSGTADIMGTLTYIAES